MRTPEVEKAISNTRAGMYCTDDADTLAAEVERLEGEHIEAMAAITAVSRAAGQERTRAEAAEARVKELEQKLSDSAEDWAFCGLGVGSTAAAAARHLEILNGYRARTKMLEAKNARLRAALEDVSLLAHCISKAGPLNTPDLETAWRKFDLISVKAAEALVDRKAVLNGEEASK